MNINQRNNIIVPILKTLGMNKSNNSCIIPLQGNILNIFQKMKRSNK